MLWGLRLKPQRTWRFLQVTLRFSNLLCMLITASGRQFMQRPMVNMDHAVLMLSLQSSNDIQHLAT